MEDPENPILLVPLKMIQLNISMKKYPQFQKKKFIINISVIFINFENKHYVILSSFELYFVQCRKILSLCTSFKNMLKYLRYIRERFLQWGYRENGGLSSVAIHLTFNPGIVSKEKKKKGWEEVPHPCSKMSKYSLFDVYNIID